MPRGFGTFTRTNGEFQGADVWKDDLNANKKVVALRHDVHDEDLALGIAQCLPKDGSEPLLGNLDFGGFNGFNLLNAANGQLQQVAAFGQTITSAAFDDPSRQLTLTREGMANIVVNIPGGGDNTIINYGVQQQFAGSGIQYVNDNVMDESNPIDTISLTDTGVSPGSYSSSDLTVDSKGRITSISSGTPANVDLANVPSLTNVLVTNSGGTDTNILDATGSRAGVMTAAQVVALDSVTGGGSFPSNLGSTYQPTTVTITNDNGAGTVLNGAGASAGVMTAAQVSALAAAESDIDDLEAAAPYPSNISATYQTSTVTLNNDNGTGVVMAPAGANAGVMTAAQVSALAAAESDIDDLELGVPYASDIGATYQATTVTLTNSNGDGEVLSAAGANAGVMTGAQVTELTAATSAIAALNEGAWVSLATATASADATVDFDGYFSATYDTYVVVMTGVKPTTDNVQFGIQIKTASVWKSGVSDYRWLPYVGSGDTTDSLIRLKASTTHGNATTDQPLDLIAYIHRPLNTDTYKPITFNGTWGDNSGNPYHNIGWGRYEAGVTALEGIRFKFASGTVAVGEFALYGIKAT